MKANDFVSMIKSLTNQKTIYVKGANGVKMTQANKLKFTGSNPFNSKRSDAIFAVTDDTIGIDEIGLINKFVDDGTKFTKISDIIERCTDISKDFSTIVPGEIVFGPDRVGVYVSGEVVTVNISGVSVVSTEGWVSHGKLIGIEYSASAFESKTSKDDEPIKEAKDEPNERDMEVYSSGVRRRH